MYRFNIEFWLMVLVCGEIIVYSLGDDDYYYKTCVPKNCGDGRNISYPFYIVGLQEPFCGIPGFELTCDEAHGYPLLHTPGNDFIVGDIDYRNSFARLKNAAVENSSCAALPGLLQNVTLDAALFNVVSPKIVLLSNCSNISSQIPGDFERINQCGGGGEYYIAMLENDTNLLAGMVACDGENVVVPMDLEQAGGGRVVGRWDFEEVVKRGFLIKFLASNCSECYDSGGRCGFDEKNLRFQCYCPDRPHYKSCSSRKSPRGKKKPMPLIIVSVTVGSVIILACLCLVIFVIRRRYKHMKLSYRPRYLSWKKSTRDLEDGSVYFGVPVFSCAELEQATNNFDPSKELGDGGFGTVYYGKLRDGREVAVKRLYENNYKRVEHFKNEVDILTRLRHPNLVLLYGCTSRRSRELLLVYEYIPNGTVADHLHGERAKSSSLTWPIRMNIAIETASGLAYLHASEIIHRDVKTNNILLDENFNVKVADFGLSRLWPNDVSHVSTAPQGTPGYVDPEYHQCYQLTDKSDVYSFGVVLIELISSMPAVDISRQRDEINLSNLAINRIQRGAFDELMDPNLGFKTDPTVERATMLVAELAFRCLQFDKESRPTMKEALEILKEIQGEESAQEGRDSVGELTNVKPPHSPETEEAVLLKTSTFPPSPISVTDKWYSSRSTTPSASGGVE